MDKCELDSFLTYKNWYYNDFNNYYNSHYFAMTAFNFSLKECDIYYDLIVKNEEEWFDYIRNEYGSNCDYISIFFENKFYE